MADGPMATLPTPVVLLSNAASPMAVLKSAVLLYNAKCPYAVLLDPVTLRASATWPVAVFEIPVVVLERCTRTESTITGARSYTGESV